MSNKRQKFDIDEALDHVDLSFNKYTPSEEAFEFFNLIRIFFGEDFEVPNPKFHYFIVDMLYGNVTANQFPYPDFICDTITVNPSRVGVISTRGSAKALSLDSKVYTTTGVTTIKDVNIGDKVLTRDGITTEVIGKSVVFNKPVYKVTLADGRVIKMSDDHENIVWQRASKSIKAGNSTYHTKGSRLSFNKEITITAKEMYENGWYTNRKITAKNPKGREPKYFIPNITKAIEYPYNTFPVDPYTVGVILGDGSIDKKTGYTRVTAEMDDYFDYQLAIPYDTDSVYWKDSSSRTGQKIAFFSLKGVGPLIKKYIGTNDVYNKQVPGKLKYGSKEQRLQVLRGLMDTDGSMEKSGTVSFCNTSKQLIDDVAEIVRSLGGKAKISEGTSGSTFGKYWKVYIRLPEGLVPFRLTRKVKAFHKYYPKWTTKDMRTAITNIEIADIEPTQCIAVKDESKSFLTNDYTITHNSTITTLFYPIVASIKGTTKVTGPLSHMLLLSDSAQGGARDQALLMGNAFKKSKFAKEWFEKIRSTETELEVVRKGTEPIEKRHMLIKFKGAQALSLDSRVYTDEGLSCIAHCNVGDRIYGPDGKLCTIIEKSEVFYKPMYKLVLKDGRELKVSDDHINSIMYKHNNYKNGTPYENKDITTKELLELPMWITNKTTGYKTPRLWIENTAPVEYTKKELPIDPYTLGLVLGDGYFHINDYSVKLTGAKKDMEYYYTQIPYEIGYKDTSREESSIVATIKGIAKDYRFLGLHETKAQNKFIPDMYKRGSIEQRLALLQGLIDTDGTIANGKRGTRFMTTSPKLAEDVMNLVRSLGGTASSSISNKAGEIVTIQGKTATRNYDLIRVYIHLNMPTARLPRKVKKLDNNTDAGRVAIIDIEKIETEESQCIKVDNESHQFLTSNYTRTHNSGGIRSGSRNPVTGDRYAIIIADDVIKNEAEAYSEVIMHNVTTALNSDALNAMRAKNTQLVLINTPFHKRDPIYMLVESGGFTPLVTPICEEIREDLTEEEFRGLWPDMHDYVSVMERFRNAMATNSTKAFYQELMLRVANEEDRLITDDMLNGQWFDRTLIMKMIEGYNIYITTDFTTTSAAKSDFSALAVWAISSNNDYFLMDLCLRRQELQQQYDELFRMVSTWSKGGKPVEVGIEIDGQQKAHLFAIKEMMQKKNIYFSFARQKGAPVTREGILSKAGGANKFERFRFVLPMLQNRKVFFPEQLKENPEMREAIKQLKGTTHSGFSTHDDFCDVVSQLGLIDILPGSEANPEEELTDVSKFFWGSLEDDDKYEGSKSTIF